MKFIIDFLDKLTKPKERKAQIVQSSSVKCTLFFKDGLTYHHSFNPKILDCYNVIVLNGWENLVDYLEICKSAGVIRVDIDNNRYMLYNFDQLLRIEVVETPTDVTVDV